MTTPIPIKRENAIEETPTSGPSSFGQPHTPLHEQNWQDCQPLCPCGESHPASITETTIPIRAAPSSEDAALLHVHDIADDNSNYEDFTCSNCGAQIGDEDVEEALKRFWDGRAIKWEKDNNLLGSEDRVVELAQAAEEPSNEFGQISDTGEGENRKAESDKASVSSGDGEKAVSLSTEGEQGSLWDTTNCLCGGTIRPWIISSPAKSFDNSEKDTVYRLPWYNTWCNPASALKKLIETQEIIRMFKRITADANSSDAHSVPMHPKCVQPATSEPNNPKIKKALENKYLAVFGPSLTKEGAERLAEEAMDEVRLSDHWWGYDSDVGVYDSDFDYSVAYFDLEEWVE